MVGLDAHAYLWSPQLRLSMEGVGEVVEVMAAEQGSGGGGPLIGVGARLGGREEAQTSPGSPRRRQKIS